MSTKNQTRKLIRSALAQLSDECVQKQSELIAAHLIETPEYKDCTAVSIYLPMKKEVSTYPIIKRLFDDQKKVYVPKVTGPGRQDMIHIHVRCAEDIADFPKNHWGIPEPPDCYCKDSDQNALVDIDLVLIPGMAFDRHKKRLGHGKGYYDSFFEKLNETKAALDKPQPYLMGLSLAEQLVEEVPVEEHDWQINGLIVPDGLI